MAGILDSLFGDLQGTSAGGLLGMLGGGGGIGTATRRLRTPEEEQQAAALYGGNLNLPSQIPTGFPAGTPQAPPQDYVGTPGALDPKWQALLAGNTDPYQPNAQLPPTATPTVGAQNGPGVTLPQMSDGGFGRDTGPQNPLMGLLGGIGNLFGASSAQAAPAPGAAQQPGIPAQAAAGPAPAVGPGLFGRLQAGATNLSSGGNPLAGLINAVGGLATGERTDRQGIALKNQATLAQSYYQALKANPDISDQQARVLAQTAAVDPETRKALLPLIHKTPQLVTTTDEYGRQHINVVDAEKGTQFEARQPGGAVAGGDTGAAATPGTMGDAYAKIQAAREAGATPEEMLQHVPIAYKSHVQGLLDGRELPASLGRGKNRENILGIAQAMGLDEGQLKARMEFARDFGNTKTGLGFKLIAGGKVLNHLEGAIDSAIAVNNRDVPTGFAGYVVHPDVIRGINAIGNNPAQQRFAAQRLKNEAENMSLEKGNFLSGQGGGSAAEREKTAAAYDPNSPRSNLAGTAQGDLDLMKGQYASLNAQRDRALGVNSDAKKFQVLLPEQEAQMKRIQEKIDTLKAGGGAAGGAAATAPENAGLKPGKYIWSPQNGVQPK